MSCDDLFCLSNTYVNVMLRGSAVPVLNGAVPGLLKLVTLAVALLDVSSPSTEKTLLLTVSFWP